MSEMKLHKLPVDFSFSQSSLQDYYDCPRRFQLRYMEKLSWPAVETEPMLENERRQQEGLAFHRLVQQHLVGLPTDKLSRMAVTPNLKQWWDRYFNARELQELIKKSRLHPELILFAPVSGYHLQAKFDLVLVTPENKILILDWKTYRSHPRDEVMAARLQTLVYRSLILKAGQPLLRNREIDPEEVTMMYWYTEFPDKPARFPYSAVQFTRDWDAISSLVDEILQREEFPATEDIKKCSYCVYRSYCDRGKKAGTLDEMDSELNSPSDLDINLEQVAEVEF
jgi:hypothetical protein